MKILSSITSIFLAFLVSSMTYAASSQLSGYNDLLNALREGTKVRAIINFDGCTAKDGTKTNLPPNMVGGFSFNVFHHYPVKMDAEHTKYAVATAIIHMTDHPSFGFVTNYVRLRVFADNTVELHSAFYDPKTYEQKRAMDYSCKMAEKAGDVGVLLITSS